MISGLVIKEIKINGDDRGWLAEAYRNDESDFSPAMAYVSYTKFGVVRGPHEHKSQSDYFVFVGPGNFALHLWDNRPESSTYQEHLSLELGETRPAAVLVPPGVVHGYQCLSETGAICYNLPDRLYKGKGKSEEVDEIRWENDQNSPYKI